MTGIFLLYASAISGMVFGTPGERMTASKPSSRSAGSWSPATTRTDGIKLPQHVGELPGALAVRGHYGDALPCEKVRSRQSGTVAQSDHEGFFYVVMFLSLFSYYIFLTSLALAGESRRVASAAYPQAPWGI